MTYREALLYLERVQGRGIKLGLENVGRLLDAMGRPHHTCASVAVAGTNGKGSVCAFLSSILSRAGMRAGLYTSPHLVRYEERIAVDGRPIDEAAFASAIGAVAEKIEELMASGALASHPTHFEILTAAALAHFAEARVDAAVLEVGMGGRLDAVGIAPAAVSVITTIGLEHTQFLGSTHEAIAAEKAGIMRAGQTAISGVDHPGAARVILEKAATLGVKLVQLAGAARIEDEPGRTGSFTLTTQRERYEGLLLPLAGRHQRDNAAMAVLAAEALDAARVLPRAMTKDAVIHGIAQTRWPGRLQIVAREPLFLIDGAHNPAGCAALARAIDALHEEGAFERLCVIFGALKEKDVVSMAREIFPRAHHLILTRGRAERFRDPGDLARETADARGAAATIPAVVEDLGTAIDAARSRCGPRDAMLLCGSLYLVGDALELMGIEPFPRAAAASRA